MEKTTENELMQMNEGCLPRGLEDRVDRVEVLYCRVNSTGVLSRQVLAMILEQWERENPFGEEEDDCDNVG